MIRAAALLLTLTLTISACGASSADATSAPQVARGFTIARIGTVEGARELSIAPNGDLFIGTSGSRVMLIRNAEGAAETARVAAEFPDRPAAGVAVTKSTVYVGTQFGVWTFPYSSSMTAPAQPVKLFSVRTEGGAQDHLTTSVAVAGKRLVTSVGSPCDDCGPQLDATRATVLESALDGSGRRIVAKRIRNAIALAVQPATNSVWAGVAGQDKLAPGHPYEIFDKLPARGSIADYGWPHCYENRRPVASGDQCAATRIPLVVLPAYATPIGAAFYPHNMHGSLSFPTQYRGGAFVTLHGSWHAPPVAPRVVFVPMRGDTPQRPVDWQNPNRQWSPFVTGFQQPDGTRTGRPTGITVGPQGSLFLADDQTGNIYRIRPQR